jgi:ATP-dependent Clp protease ATP-binding subunit ClpA
MEMNSWWIQLYAAGDSGGIVVEGSFGSKRDKKGKELDQSVLGQRGAASSAVDAIRRVRGGTSEFKS